MQDFSVDYEPKEIIDPITGKTIINYLPLIDILISGSSHRIRKVTCLIDSGADYNVFPTEIAFQYLGMSQRSFQKGKELLLSGIGNLGLDKPAYGHKVVFQHPHFKFDTWAFFVDNQYPPLLGRRGFIDRFTKIIFDELNKKLVFSKETG